MFIVKANFVAIGHTIVHNSCLLYFTGMPWLSVSQVLGTCALDSCPAVRPTPLLSLFVTCCHTMHHSMHMLGAPILNFIPLLVMYTQASQQIP